jgi:hypothetical protein
VLGADWRGRHRASVCPSPGLAAQAEPKKKADAVVSAIAPPGLDPKAAQPPEDEPPKKSGSRIAGAELPLLGSNQDSPDPEGSL